METAAERVSHPSRRGPWPGTVLLLAAALVALPGAARGQDDQLCLGCHGQPGLTKTLVDGRTVSLYMDQAVLKASVHRELGCVACHTDAATVPHPIPSGKVVCGTCHASEQEDYLTSIHGQHLAKGAPGAPRCTTCHGTHEVLQVKNPSSAAHPINLMRVCTGCHEDPEMKGKYDLPGPAFIKAYERSVHGQAIRRGGLVVTAVCNDCHGSHTILPADDPRSAVHRKNIPEDCGKCHAGITEVYWESIHGQAVAAGSPDAPVCTDCHGEHTILKPTDPRSGVSPKNIPTTCSACHEDVKLAAAYNLPPRRLVTYLESYHGVANKFGEAVVANCASCHGAHDIRPSTDPQSSIHKDNLPSTCGKCHPGAGKHFAEGLVHVEATKESLYGKWLVRRFYTIFISILVLLFVSYVALDLLGHWRRKHSDREGSGHGH
ncbi:MAG: hypothetical protein ACE5KY_01265 [Candidatus Tectimicrobiota bacterium]